MYRDMNFIIYHSGYNPDVKEGPYIPGPHKFGTDTLIQSVLDYNVARGSNVYAEIGASWRYLMKDPDQAAHFIGKLLKCIGKDNVVWGTDSIFYGAPQDQIQAFQTFQIAPEFQEKYGYPSITPEIRAKIFGLNSARLYGISREDIRKARFGDLGGDPIKAFRTAYTERADPSFMSYGPRTRSEFLRFARSHEPY